MKLEIQLTGKNFDLLPDLRFLIFILTLYCILMVLFDMVNCIINITAFTN